MRAAFIAALVVLSGPALAAPPQWTWEAGKQTNNGAITIKSTNGSTSYSGTQNPTGAVAKTNQNAVTQPPTVIIQATSSGGYSESIPMVSIGTNTIPTCPVGFTSAFSKFGAGYLSATAIFNIAGSRFNFGNFYASGNYYVGFLPDNYTGAILGLYYRYDLGYVADNSTLWAVALCTK